MTPTQHQTRSQDRSQAPIAGHEPGSPGSATAPPAPHGRTVLDAADIARALTRISYEIIERNKGATDLVVLGIPSRGVPLAERIAARLGELQHTRVPVGALDVTMYRDDLRLKPARPIGHTHIPEGGVDGKIVVLVDDVLFSGRTIRAALDAIVDVGRPRYVQLAVLVDRGHRELPIRADFVGKNLPTATHEKVRVLVEEHDATDAVLIAADPHPDTQTGNQADNQADTAAHPAADSEGGR